MNISDITFSPRYDYILSYILEKESDKLEDHIKFWHLE